MGVSGAGKTTVGRLLAASLGWPFVEGDAFHPPANVEKMRRGDALTDADRAPWLSALRRCIDELAAAGRSAVVSCSALKQSYRDVLAAERPEVRFVWLTAPPELLLERVRHRGGHYMPPELLESQLVTLEPPVGALRIDATAPPAASVDAIVSALGAGRGRGSRRDAGNR